MNEKIDLEIQYTVDDYVRGVSFVQNRQFLVKYGFLILPLIPLAFFGFTLLLNPEGISQISLKYVLITFVPFLAIPLLLLLLKFIPNPFLKWNIKRQFKSSPVMQEAQRVSVDETGIKGQTSLSAGETRWNAVIEATETDEDFFFFTSNKMAMFIPKRSFESVLQQDQVRALAKRKLGDKARF